MKKIVRSDRREYLVDDRRAAIIRGIWENGKNPSQIILVNGDSFKISLIKSIDSAGYDQKDGLSPHDRIAQDFAFDEQEYRRQSVEQKVNREYYSRFMNLIIANLGIKKVLGADYRSPMLDIPFDKEIDFKFMADQKAERIRRFEAYLIANQKERAWGSDIKEFFQGYFQNNPGKSWCPVEEWLPFMPDIPTGRYDKALIRHQKMVDNQG